MFIADLVPYYIARIVVLYVVDPIVRHTVHAYSK